MDQQIIEQFGGNPIYRFNGSVQELAGFMANKGADFNYFIQDYVVYVVTFQQITDDRLELIHVG